MSKRSSDSVGRNARAARAGRRRAFQRARLQVRELDSRCCPSCTVQVVDGHILEIRGDQGANVVAVTEGNSGIIVVCDGQKAGTFTGINQLVIRTFGGDDTVKYLLGGSAEMPPISYDLGG